MIWIIVWLGFGFIFANLLVNNVMFSKVVASKFWLMIDQEVEAEYQHWAKLHPGLSDNYKQETYAKMHEEACFKNIIRGIRYVRFCSFLTLIIYTVLGLIGPVLVLKNMIASNKLIKKFETLISKK